MICCLRSSARARSMAMDAGRVVSEVRLHYVQKSAQILTVNSAQRARPACKSGGKRADDGKEHRRLASECVLQGHGHFSLSSQTYLPPSFPFLPQVYFARQRKTGNNSKSFENSHIAIPQCICTSNSSFNFPSPSQCDLLLKLQWGKLTKRSLITY